MLREHPALLRLALTYALFQFGFFVPLHHLAPFAELDAGGTGLGASAGAAAITAIGFGNAVGRTLIGGVADKVGTIRSGVWCMALTAVATALWPFCTTLPLIVAFGFAFGTFACAYASIGPMATARLVPVRDLSAAIGLVLGPAMIPGALCASPIAGVVREATGSYLISAMTSAAVFALTAWMLSTVRIVDGRAGGKEDSKGGGGADEATEASRDDVEDDGG